MWSDGFDNLPGLVGFVSRSVNAQEGFTLGFEPEEAKLDDSIRSVNELIARPQLVSNSDSSVLDWMDETIGEALRLRRY